MASRKVTPVEATETTAEALAEGAMKEEETIRAAEKAQTKAVKAEAKAEEAPVAVDEWEEFIDIVVPRHGRGQEKNFFVAVNGRNAQIPADGKLHHIRKPLALALLESLEAEAQAEQFAEDLPHEAAPASFADLMNVINDLRSKLRASGIEV